MKTSVFNLSHEKKLTCNMGELVPILCEQLHPGDIWRQKTNLLLRTQPLLAPVMHKVDISLHVWAVPNRLLQTNWEKFITGGQDGLDATVAPTITVNTGTGFAVGSLADYFGFPTGTDDITVSAFPFRAYASIWNNWYRDEQLQTELTVSTGDGPDTTTNTTLQNGCWQKDYFTAARPNAQLGAAVAIPLTGDAVVTGTAPVLGLGTPNQVFGGGPATAYESNGASRSYTHLRNVDSSTANGQLYVEAPAAGSTYPNIRADADATNSTLTADLSSVSAVSIDELREVNAFQRFKEKTNRLGARYTEYLRSFFGVTPQDMRLQLPEFVGSGRMTIQFSEVLQTAPTLETTTPLATLAGHGISAGHSNGIVYKAQEHCVLMVLMCVRPKTDYYQGVRRQWLYNSKYDYLIPEFANLGDQEVYNAEIYAQGTSADTDVFGYAPKYDELRYIPNSVAGEFRTTLDYWHMARKFASLPALNGTFVKSDPTNRIYAITTEDQLQIRCMHKIKAKRRLPKTSRPYLY